MPAPRIPPIPRFAADSVPLATALDLFGKALDPEWTGEEIAADSSTAEPSDDALEYTALKRVTGDAANNPTGEVGDAKPTVAQIEASLHEKRDIEFAARRRRNAAVMQLMGYLHHGILTASATGLDDGMVYMVPPRIWGATCAEHLFDGGYLDVSAGKLVVPRSERPEHPATVLVKKSDLERLIEAIKGGDIPPAVPPTLTEVQQVDPARTGYPGRPSLKRAIEAEFRRRVEGGEHETTLKAQGEALQRWAGETYPGVAIPTPETIRNQIRSLYNTLLQGTK
jgi:hypothetical protein